MKLSAFIEQVYSLRRDTEILLDVGKSKAVDFTIEEIKENGQIVGLVIVEEKQLKLPFED